MGKIKSLFIAIGFTLIGIGIFFLVPIILAIATFVITCIGIVLCLVLVYSFIEEDRKYKTIVHKEEDT